MGYYLTEQAQSAMCPTCRLAIMETAVAVYTASYGVAPQTVDVSPGLKCALVTGSEGTELYTFEELGFGTTC